MLVIHVVSLAEENFSAIICISKNPCSTVTNVQIIWSVTNVMYSTEHVQGYCKSSQRYNVPTRCV